jgi:hypothetical protein
VLSTRVLVFVVDMPSETPWGRYHPKPAALGMRSSMSYPPITGETTGGALAVGLRMAEQDSETRTCASGSDRAPSSTRPSDILMGQQRCSTEDAFAILRRASRRRNIKLSDAATHIVASVQRQTPGKSFGRY